MDVVSAPIAVAPRAAAWVSLPSSLPSSRPSGGRGANRSRVGRRRLAPSDDRAVRRAPTARPTLEDDESLARRLASELRERARAAPAPRTSAPAFRRARASLGGISLVSVATVVLGATECFFAGGENLERRAAASRRNPERPDRVSKRRRGRKGRARRTPDGAPSRNPSPRPPPSDALGVGRRDAARGAAAAPAFDADDSDSEPPSSTRPTDSSSSEPLTDENWRDRPPPRRELPPPPGITAGDVVWVRLRGSLRSGAKRKKTPPAAAKATAAAGDVPGEPVGGAEAEAEASGVWWPGRAWKLRHCASAAALWRDRGAPPSVPRALVRCFGDGSFVWAA